MIRFLKKFENGILLVLFGLCTFPVFFYRIENGLDSSWVYILNKLTSFPQYKFGKDVIFTYGPLGFLAYPMYLNGNWLWGILFYMFLWASLLILFGKLLGILHKQEHRLGKILLSIFLIFLGPPTYASDLFVEYCVILSLVVLWFSPTDRFASVFFIIVSTMAFFFKFSIAISIICVVFLYVFAKFVRNDFRALFILLVPFLTIPLCYFVYNPSFNDFVAFCKGSWEISSGFNSAMSLDLNDSLAVWMFILMALYAMFMTSQLLFGNTNNFLCMLWVSPCLFMAYKHGYVRADGHIYNGYMEILAIFSAAILTFDFDELYGETLKKTKKGIIQTSLFLSLLMIAFMDYPCGLNPGIIFRNRFHRIFDYFDYMNVENNEKDVNNLSSVSDSFIREIGNDSFTSFPWEIAFIEKTGDMANHFVPLPTLQAYSAYTPYLDELTADFFRGSNAPEYIIFNLKTIDGRIPLIETPSTWKAVWDNYELIVSSENDYLLKRKNLTTERYADVITGIFGKSDIIDVHEYREVRIHAELGLSGKIIQFLWKIPPVEARLVYSDGHIEKGRVLLSNLSNGVSIRVLPYNNDTFVGAMNNSGPSCSINSIQIEGEGLNFYKSNFIVDFLAY